jgi:hypothetical protein
VTDGIAQLAEAGVLTNAQKASTGAWALAAS